MLHWVKRLDYPHNCKTENNACNLTVDCHCLQAMKILHLQAATYGKSIDCIIFHNVWYVEMESLD